MDGLGNKDKNRNFDVIDLEGLLDWCCQVLIFRLQHAGMTRGAAYQWGALLTELGRNTTWTHKKCRALPKIDTQPYHPQDQHIESDVD